VTISADLYLAGDSQTVTVNNAPGMVVSGTVGGTDGLIKSGTGGLTLSGVGNYGGATTLNNGDLVFSGSVCNTSAVNVLGGDLEVDGSSNIAAPVNLNGGELSGRGIVGPIASNNGTVSPGLTATGTTVGVLTVGGNVNLSGSTTFSLRLGVETGGDHDMLSVTGGGLVSLDDPPLQIVAGGSLYNSSNIGLTYIIISGGAAETGTGADVFSYDGTPIPDDGTFSIPGGYDFELVYGTDSQGSDDMGTGSNVDLVLEGIPEPRTWEMVAGGVVLLWACRRRFGITTRR
jgi:autotransporter-associated beta strand protein